MPSFRGLTLRTNRTADSRDRRTTGQALVEFAFILPVMCALLLLALDFGRLFYTFIAVNNAAREAAFLAGTRAADSDYDAE